MNPTIVISAYNRPQALARLLASLRKAAYPKRGATRLVISIDRGDDPRNGQVVEVAKEFEWPFGHKEVIHEPEHLGLVRHVFFCCGLTQVYGDVIFLEDDLLVSPAYYTYAARALSFYRSDERIAGVSLYALWFNGYTQQPFIPLADDADAFFLQTPYTQGQAFTYAQWKSFADWRAAGDRRLTEADNLHESFFHFDAEDWFPMLAKYVVETGRYVVYPRVSLTTGAGDAGTHFAQASSFFQTPLQRFKENYRLKPLADSVAVYDSFFELLPDRLNRLTDAFRGFDYDVDLYATKARRNLRAEYVLTSRLCRTAQQSFGKVMWPMEANVIENVPGTEIAFCRADDVRWDWWSDLETRKRNHDFFTRRRKMSRRLRLMYAIVDLVRALQRRLRRGNG